ncbi:MAG: hypothetical protein NZ988_02660 [Thaumarchaeota archaeon]|nr:hypothetical protein [Candidatus Calditenuaceae archaeon]MDW8186935.1 hypothetical protein [Nitrososphaerota archaeon]
MKYEYTISAPVEEVRRFFYDPRNLEKVWPSQFRIRLLSDPTPLREGAEYRVAVRLLGQEFPAGFRIVQLDDSGSVHETYDFPFGRIWHRQQFSPMGQSTKVVEEFEVRDTMFRPIAERVLGRALSYRLEAIRSAFGEGSQPSFRDPFRIPLHLGNALSVLMVALAALLTVYDLPWPLYPLGKFVAWFLLWFFTHDLLHWAVGSLVGVKFSHYYIGLSAMVNWPSFPAKLKPLVLALGIKIDRKNSRANSGGFASMYFAGALASMIFPFAVPLFLLLRSLNDVVGLLLLAASAGNAVFSSYLSTKYGCIGRGLRALRTGSR